MSLSFSGGHLFRGNFKAIPLSASKNFHHSSTGCCELWRPVKAPQPANLHYFSSLSSFRFVIVALSRAKSTLSRNSSTSETEMRAQGMGGTGGLTISFRALLEFFLFLRGAGDVPLPSLPVVPLSLPLFLPSFSVPSVKIFHHRTNPNSRAWLMPKTQRSFLARSYSPRSFPCPSFPPYRAIPLPGQ